MVHIYNAGFTNEPARITMDLYWYDCSPIVLQPVSFRKFLSGTGSVVNWDNITKLDRQIFCFVPDKV